MSFDTIEILSIYTADGTELFITDDEANDTSPSYLLKEPRDYAYDTKLEAVESYAGAKIMGVMDDKTHEALEGILNMLDAWSDEHHKEGTEPCGK